MPGERRMGFGSFAKRFEGEAITTSWPAPASPVMTSTKRSSAQFQVKNMIRIRREVRPSMSAIDSSHRRCRTDSSGAPVFHGAEWDQEGRLDSACDPDLKAAEHKAPWD